VTSIVNGSPTTGACGTVATIVTAAAPFAPVRMSTPSTVPPAVSGTGIAWLARVSPGVAA
jgi:hypothetical protein